MSSIPSSTLYLKDLGHLAHYGPQPWVQIIPISELHHHGSLVEGGLQLRAFPNDTRLIGNLSHPSFSLRTFSYAISSSSNVSSLMSAIIYNPTLQVVIRMRVLC